MGISINMGNWDPKAPRELMHNNLSHRDRLQCAHLLPLLYSPLSLLTILPPQRMIHFLFLGLSHLLFIQQQKVLCYVFIIWQGLASRICTPIPVSCKHTHFWQPCRCGDSTMVMAQGSVAGINNARQGKLLSLKAKGQFNMWPRHKHIIGMSS